MTATDMSPPRSPLQQDYQRFLLLGSRRAPHTVHVHETGYRSGTINTDALGLRYSHCAGKRFSAAERGGASILLPPGMAVGLFFLTVTMCVSAGLVSIRKVTTIDPAMVFRGA